MPTVCSCVPDRRKLILNLPFLFSDPTVRPPVLEEMQSDIDRTIASLATKYTDHTCPQLHFDELMAEGRYKLAQFLDKGVIDRQPNRVSFFKYFKTAVANQFRSLVQKYRFTHKRTGQKPPPRHRAVDAPRTEAELEAELNHHKNVEISMDDPESNLQIPDEGHIPHADQELLEDYMAILQPHERYVLASLVSPNAETLAYAYCDANRGRRAGGPIHVKIRMEHRAKGLGLPLDFYKNTVLSIQVKVTAYNAMSTDELDANARRNAVLQQLALAFGLQIPSTVDDIVIRRMLTIAARDQYEKINGQTADLLAEIGAKVPRVYADRLNCYGTMFHRTDKRCNSCGLRNSCAVEAANVGLGKITISPRLLGTRMTRVPAILPALADETPVEPAASETSATEDMEIVAYLNETFTPISRNGQRFYIHQPHRKRRLLFCLEDSNSPIRLRFCGPSAKLKARLVGKQKSWYPPESLSTDDLIALIDQHAQEAFVERVPAEETNA